MRRNLTLSLIFLGLISLSFCDNLTKDILKNFENKPLKDVFKAWHYAYEKPYDLNSETALQRYKIFKQNIAYIKKVNSEQRSYRLGLGPDTDLTYEEYTKGKETQLPHLDQNHRRHERNDVNFNDYFLDAINPTWMEGLKDWSYLVDYIPESRRSIEDPRYPRCYQEELYMVLILMYETHMKINNFPYEKLSHQSFFDCYRGIKHRCKINSSVSIFREAFLQRPLAGIYAERVYPLREDPETIQSCKENRTKYTVTAKTDMCSAFLSPCTLEIKREMMERGPVAVTLTESTDLQHYSEGILDAEKCTDLDFSTSVLLVQITKDYVKVVMPKGKKYGEEGYVKISRKFSEQSYKAIVDGKMIQFRRIALSCGAEYEMVSPIGMKYVGDRSN